MWAVKTQRGNFDLALAGNSRSRLPKRSRERASLRLAAKRSTYCTTRDSTNGAVGIEQSSAKTFMLKA